MPEDTGVRITPKNSENGGGPGFDLSLAAGPDAGDQVVESDSARVYLPPAAARDLDDQTLDAQMTDENRVKFHFAPQTNQPH
jgi:Fe-S cluster assembly iron-binding protein IscA